MASNHNKNVFKQIFEDHWAGFLSMEPEYYEGIVKKMLGCGDPKNGFISYRCPRCGDATLPPLVPTP